MSSKHSSRAVRPKRDADKATIQAFDRDSQRQVKRNAVLKTAAHAFNRQGFANTSMDDVAKSLGVTKPTLYQYFPSKEDILYECHKLSMAQAEAAISIAQSNAATGLQKLLEFFRVYIRGLLGDFGSCPVLTNVDSLSPERRNEVVARRARISAAARGFIKEGIRDGSIAKSDPGLAALFTLGAVNWIPLWYREDGPNTPNEIVEAFTNFLSCSIAARPAAPSKSQEKSKRRAG